MNKNIKLLATILPLIVVPLINERKNISKHPDMQKLGAVSNSVYTRVKDRSKNIADKTYDSAQHIGEKITDTLEERSYNKEQKSYQKSLSKEESLEKKFEKEKAAHKEQRLQDRDDKNQSIVPKIFQSHQEKTSEEIADGMTVSDEFIAPHEESPDINVDKKTEPDNEEPVYGEMYMFENDENKLPIRKKTSIKESSEKMTNIENLNEEENVQHIEEEGETLSLHEQHKQTLDPRSTARNKYAAEKKQQKQELRNDNSLFNQHRRLNFEHANSRTRTVGDGSAYIKDQSIKDYEALMFNK